jgi:hypothetical protein
VKFLQIGALEEQMRRHEYVIEKVEADYDIVRFQILGIRLLYGAYFLYHAGMRS